MQDLWGGNTWEEAGLGEKAVKIIATIVASPFLALFGCSKSEDPEVIPLPPEEEPKPPIINVILNLNTTVEIKAGMSVEDFITALNEIFKQYGFDKIEDINFEDIDLDFEIEDDEAEAGKEESFKANGSLFLTEDLKESSETDDFKTLLAMPEFKKPISDREVRALLGEQYESDDLLDSLAIDGFTYEILDTFKDAGYTGSNVRYSKEGQDIVDIEFWSTNEPISVVNNWLAPNLFQKTYDNFEDFSNDLIYKVAGQQNSDDASLIEGAFDKFKDKVATTLNKPLGTTATANWILENALKDYEKDPDESNRHFDHFLALCFKNQYADGEKITKAPKWDDERLLPLKDRSKKYSDYKGAEAFGKAESSKDDCGAVIIYLASKKAPNDIAMVSLFFDGTLQKDQDQIDTYYKEIAQAIASIKRYQNQSKKASKFEIK
jgi:hypothetical protein